MSDQKQLNRFWDWQSAVLVIVLMQMTTIRLAVTEWVPFLDIPKRLGGWAVLLGLALGYSAFSKRYTRWLGFLYGAILIPWQLLEVVGRKQALNEDLLSIFLRLFDALTMFVKNQPIYDALFFITFSTIGLWVIGLYMGWKLLREQSFLGVVLPAGVVILLVQVYDPVATFRLWALAIYLFAALALLGRLHFLSSRNQWATNRVFFSSDSEWDLSRSAITMAAAAVFIAWIFPNALSSIRSAANAWDEVTEPVRERFSNATSALDSPYNASTGGDFYGSFLPLGRKAPTSDTPAFYVEDLTSQYRLTRYYWRGRIYDQYKDGQWSSPQTRNIPFRSESNERVLSEQATRYQAKFSFTLNFPKQKLLYAPAEAVWMDQDSQWVVMDNADNKTRDVSVWLAETQLLAGETYYVRAMIAEPSIAELREAGEAYPQWVTERYLQIPEDIAPQIKSLAETITKDAATPYDKAEAITSFLRKEIQYSIELTEKPPEDTDPVLWMLLEYKKGFCMYTASAEVLMLRSLGIPARMAVGFAQGEFEASRKRYVVALRDSHAWPEVYFPTIGWVEFEPTANQSPLVRLQKPPEETAARNIDRMSENEDIRIGESERPEKNIEDVELGSGAQTPRVFIAQPFLYPTLLIAFFALVILLIKRYSILDRLPVYLEKGYTKRGRTPPYWIKRWSTWSIVLPAQRAFYAVDFSLRWLGYFMPIHATPHERADQLAEIMPPARESIQILKEELEIALFTNRPGNSERARRAGWKVILEALRMRF